MFLKFCCILAHTMWLLVSQKYKRRHISEAHQQQKQKEAEAETSLEGRRSVVRPTVVRPTSVQDL